MVLCADGTFYSGYSTDVELRVDQYIIVIIPDAEMFFKVFPRVRQVVLRLGRDHDRNFAVERRCEDVSDTHPHNDLPLRPPVFEICQRLLRLIERKHLVNHWPDALGLEQFTDLCELLTVWMHKQKRILDAAFLGVANDLLA